MQTPTVMSDAAAADSDPAADALLAAEEAFEALEQPAAVAIIAAARSNATIFFMKKSSLLSDCFSFQICRPNHRETDYGIIAQIRFALPVSIGDYSVIMHHNPYKILLCFSKFINFMKIK